jgi:cell shape-determining protein MreC
VRPGDLVETSGLGSIFPGQIPIGRICQVSTDREHFLKTATVTPAAGLDRLTDALLLQ